MDARDVALAAVWARVPTSDHPLLAVDGPDGAGKTTFATALAAAAGQRPVMLASVDDFHFPRSHRHAVPRTGDSVWERSFDYPALRRELLDPWRRGAGSPYRRRWHDLATDALVDEPTALVPPGGVLVFEGVFLQRPELRESWDLVVYLDAAEDVRLARMSRRDGVPADADHPDQRRYLDAQAIYLSRCTPRERADLVIDNTDPGRPLIDGA